MRSILLIAIVGGTLALFNPGQDDFTQFIRDRTRDVVGDAGRTAATELGGDVAGALGGTAARSLASEVVGALANNAVERKNYGLFSLYTLDFNGPRHDEGEWIFLGVGGQFFEMEKPRMMGS
ncbi:MAG: DUF4359 domain-containing protein [Rhodothermaceae bacterium]|nr:DUF4359 domain-containing protein [Rhodothermaceae bacterium]